LYHTDPNQPHWLQCLYLRYNKIPQNTSLCKWFS
jgi:hypothetical protein